MSSINQLVSEIAHSLGQPDSVPIKRAIELSIIHARNEIIRKSYNNNSITDKVLQQRVRLELINVLDGDPYIDSDIDITKVKRTKSKVPNALRLNNTLPFHSVRTTGAENPINIPFIKESSANFYTYLPGMQNIGKYDYINGYIYIFTNNSNILNSIKSIIVDTIFEYPQLIPIETIEGIDTYNSNNNDNEFLLPEDMINAVKKLILETFNPQVIRDTNEIPNTNLVK